MADIVLEDPDGAPYPGPVQAFVNDWAQLFGGQTLEEFQDELGEALESVIQFAKADGWDEGSEATLDWVSNNPSPAGTPSDPPRNPYQAVLDA